MRPFAPRWVQAAASGLFAVTFGGAGTWAFIILTWPPSAGALPAELIAVPIIVLAVGGSLLLVLVLSFRGVFARHKGLLNHRK